MANWVLRLSPPIIDTPGTANVELNSCDFNGDQMCDGVDADLLVAAIVNNDIGFDLTGDGQMDRTDLDEWLALAGAENLPSMDPYLLGDANLDGFVDGQDFIKWNQNKFTTSAAWTKGDFNADGFTDGQDFIIWNGNKFSSANAPTVPEPGISSLLAVSLIVLALRGRPSYRLARLATSSS